MISLIANSGIQFYKTKITIDFTNVRSRMYFREYLDIVNYNLKLELAYKFSDEDIYVSKRDLSQSGFIDSGKVNYTWQEIKNITSDIRVFNEDEIISVTSNALTKGQPSVLDKLINQWIPFPYFEKNNAGRFLMGPYNWARLKLVSTGNVIDGKSEYNLILAFDTNTVYDDGNYTDDYKESPVFSNVFDKYKEFGVSNNDFDLITFCSNDDHKSAWIDKYILQLIHNTTEINNVPNDKKYSYLASFIYFVNFISSQFSFPVVRLYRDRNIEWTNVDMVVDIGNSKTTALLFDEGNFTKVKMLTLQDFSQPQNEYSDSFDMQVAFQKADFGKIPLENSRQFKYPSFVRLGDEAKYLMYNANNYLSGNDRLAISSSPKRYLWDVQQRKKEWEYVQLDKKTEPIWIDGISEYINSDGTLNLRGSGGGSAYYSRRSLMVFSFLEMLCQARMQVNSHEYRTFSGNEVSPRRISKIIITCPTAMSNQEQVALRCAAEEAFVLLERFVNLSDDKVIDYRQISSKINIVPSVKGLKSKEERVEWSYDEATCSQFVYLCAEIAKRYRCNCSDFFELYGKQRDNLTGYNKKSLTIASLDIGAGTTDLMICAYEYRSAGQTTLKPVPLFWESFYIAGDDLLKKIVQQVVIEGPVGLVSSKLKKMGKGEQCTQLIADFFGENTNRIPSQVRQMRKDFNSQVSVPIALGFLEEARKETRSTVLCYDDFFKSKNKPNQKLLDFFFDHFGFRIEECEWLFDLSVIENIIIEQFEDLIKKVAATMSAYQSDIVLLSGRPASLKQIERLFLKYYPVSPNRLKILNKYRVGRWYPFQDGDGYFQNQKSIVAVGALIGHIASTQGSYSGLSLDLSLFKEKMTPTTNYFGLMNPVTRDISQQDIFITPDKNSNEICVPALPIIIGCRQINTSSYPSRVFYNMTFNEISIQENQKSKGYTNIDELKQRIEDEKRRIQSLMPLIVRIVRDDFQNDKENIVVESVFDRNNEEIPSKYFSLFVKSLDDVEDYWLDSGVFKLSITTR